jgi:hypothetical protein
MDRMMDHVTAMVPRRPPVVNNPMMNRVVYHHHAVPGHLGRRRYRNHHAKSHQTGNQ